MNMVKNFRNMDIGIDASVLKIIAAVTMLTDHIGAVLFPDVILLRIIGRIAFPIFAFLVAEGFVHTGNLKKYAIRMAVFAAVSELPFDFAFYGGIFLQHQNVLITFLFALAAMYADRRYGRYMGVVAAVAAAFLAQVTFCDYGAFGVLMVMLFYWFREYGVLKLSLPALLIILNLGIEQFAVAAMLPIMFYNGRKGKISKWFFYVFYPGHIIVLYMILLLLK